MPRVLNTREGITTTVFEGEVDLAPFIYPDVAAAVTALAHGDTEVVLVPHSLDIQQRLQAAVAEDAAHMFDWFNNAVKPERRVPNPTTEMVRNPEQHLAQWKPYIGKGKHRGKNISFRVANLDGGMVNLYGSKTEDLFLSDETVAAALATITGTEQWRAHQNRWRIVVDPGSDWTDSMHTEGPLACTDDALTMPPGIICPVSRLRSFVWWEGSVADPERRRAIGRLFEQRRHRGRDPNFVSFTEEDARTLPALQGRRRRIIFGSQYFLLFSAGVMHEVDNAVAGSGVFLSPYNPARPEQQNTWTPGQDNAQPPEYRALANNIERERLGLLFQMAGSQWPSKKRTFHLYHQQAGKAVSTNLRAEYHHENTVTMRLPQWGTVQHPDQAALVAQGLDLIPDIAFADDTPPWIINPVTRYTPLLQYRRQLRSVFPGAPNQAPVEIVDAPAPMMIGPVVDMGEEEIRQQLEDDDEEDVPLQRGRRRLRVVSSSDEDEMDPDDEPLEVRRRRLLANRQ